MPIQPLPAIRNIEPYVGGASTLPGFDRPVKLASNENALGSSPRARAAFAAASERLHIYPEGSARKLREAIAARFGVDAARIVCGAGSDEIFFLLARAFLEPGDEIVVSEHSFSIYAIAARQSGALVRAAPDRGLDVDVDAMLASVNARTKIVFVANPNNPTGAYLPYEEVRRLHAGLPDNVLLVLDAAYAEFVRRNDYSAGLELAAENENVIMTRTFSKIHGLAALRVGWGFGPPVVIDALNRTRGPFNVSIPAMEAAIAALEDQDFAQRSADYNAAELPRVTAALEAMGIRVTPSVCNFVLAHFAPGEAAKADAHLRAQGYILRPLRSYGLPDALRMTIGTAEQNDGALAALRDLMAQ
jgi:histidinol-phosphate aminotransferase